MRLSVSAHLTSHSGTPWHHAQHLPCASFAGVSYSSFKTPTLLRPHPRDSCVTRTCTCLWLTTGFDSRTAGSSLSELLLTKLASHLIVDARFVGLKKECLHCCCLLTKLCLVFFAIPWTAVLHYLPASAPVHVH